MFNRRARMAPSNYPRVPFHIIRFFQLVSSIIVGGIMSFFISALHQDGYGTPWTFVWLCAASFLSFLALAVTITLHCFFGLNTRLNALINLFLLAVWALSWSMLAWWTTRTLSNFCDIANWTEDSGIMVCRIYKVLFTFTLVGFISTIAAFILDVVVRRQQTRRGAYRLQEIDNKRLRQATGGPFADAPHEYSADKLNESRASEAWEAPRPSTGPYAESADPKVRSRGYEVPEQQFEYDTGYHGAAEVHGDGKLYDGDGVEGRAFV